MKTVLIVDDMAVIREPIAAALSSQGYSTIAASSGAEALQLLRSKKPDLLLMDVAMPGMDGLQVLRVMKADPSLPHPPVILLTSMGERASVLAARDLGIRHYLLKSQFSMEDLIGRVRAALGEVNSAQATDGKAAETRPVRAQAMAAAPTAAHSMVEPQLIVASPKEASVHSSAAAVAVNLDQLKPLIVRSELLRRIDSGLELRALSPSATEVLQLTESSNASAEIVAKAIKRDPSLALKVLRLANSAAFSRGDKVQSVDQAVVRIGMGKIHQAVLNLNLVDRFKSNGPLGGLDVLQFWEHSIACGIIAAELARDSGKLEPDAAFTMGLLHDVGQIVYAEQLGDTYAQVLNVAVASMQPVETVETKLLQLNHAEITSQILRAWRFPQSLIDPIACHHLSLDEMRRQSHRHVHVVALLALADRLAHALMLGSSGNETIYPTEELAHELKIPASAIARIEAHASEQTDEIKFALLAAGAGQVAWPQRREVHRASLGVPMRVMHVSAEPQVDAIRVFGAQMSDASLDRPTLGVVHVRHAREKEILTAACLHAEAEAGVQRLPLIVISPDGRTGLDDRALSGRQFRLLATPFTVAGFIQTARQLLREPAQQSQAA